MRNLLKTFASFLPLLGERVGVRAGAQTLTASLLALLILSTLTAGAASIITATVTITNTPVVTNTFVYNSDTRTWQTNNSSTRIQATNSIAQSVTNLYQHFVTYPLVGPVSVRITTSSNLTFVSPTSTNVSITFGGSGWGRVSYITNNVASGFTVTVPDANITNRPTATNIASGLIDWLKYASNTMSATAPAWTNFLTIAPNGKTFTNVIFSTPAITGGGLTNTVVTNAPSISGSNIALVTGTLTNVTERMSTNINPVIQGAREISGTIGSITNGNAYGTTITNSPAIQVTNLIARGGYFSNFIGHTITITNLDAPGTGPYSQRIGLNSIAGPGEGSLAFGVNASATNTYGLAIGVSATSEGANGVAVGPAVAARGYYSIILGNGESEANGSRSIVIGQSSFAAYTNSVAFGSYVTTLGIGEFRIGNSSNYFSLGGPIMGLVSSNSLLKGFSTNSSSWTETSSTVTTLANGHNNVVISDSTSFAKLSGPSAAFYLDGLTNGWTDRVVTLKNDSGYNMTVTPESGLVDSANRFATASGNDYLVETNSTVVVKYLSSRWWVIGGSALLSTNVLNTRTNTAVLTNGVLVASLTNGFTLNFSAGLTGYVSGNVLTLGASSSAGSTNFIANNNGTGTNTTNFAVLTTGHLVATNITNSTLIASSTIRSTGGNITANAGVGYLGIGNGSITTAFNQGNSGNYDEVAFYRSDTAALGMMTYGYGTGLGTPAIHFTNANIYLGSAARNFNTATNPVNVPYVNARLGVLLPAATPFTAPASLNITNSAHLWSDGTNLCIVFQNSAGTRTTNKVTMTAWP